MHGIWHDLRFGIRGLGAHPHFSIVAIFLLALGIGTTTAVFSVVNAVLLRPLPYHDPTRLVAVTSLYKSGSTSRTSPVIVLADMAQWRKSTSSFASMGSFAYTQLPVRVGSQAFSPVTALMDPEFLPTLGRPLAMGAFFDATPRDGSDMSAIVSHGFWRTALEGDPAAIGRFIEVDGVPYVVRGVLDAEYQFPRSDASYFTKPVDLLIPSSSFEAFPARSRQWFGIARLEPDVSLQQAEAELQAVAEQQSRATAGPNLWSVKLAPLDQETTRRSRQALLVVLSISAVLLLIASTNLMNLFFSRGVARLGEMSIRRAIGSTTARLVRQLVVEAMVLAAAGGAIGVTFAAFAIRGLVALSPVHLPVTASISIDIRVLAFTVAACAAAALVASLFPALHVSAKSNEAVRRPGLRVAGNRSVARVQHALCVTQIALGMALLAAAGLLARSFWQLNAVDPGFDPTNVIGFNLSVPNSVSRDDRVRFYQRALEETRTIPGVQAAGLISFLPPETRAGVFMGLAIDGVPPPERNAAPLVVNTLISSAGYFATMRMAIANGRDFNEGDTGSSAPVVIVNEALVRRYLAGSDPLGRRIGSGFDGLRPVREIVGVVKDSHDRGLAAQPIPTVYIPFRQFSLPYGSIAARTVAAPESVIPVIRDRVNRLNPGVPLFDFQLLENRIAESLREPRFYVLMAVACAALAVLFVTFGLYGLISYSVSRRTSELGIRMALGAQRNAIIALVLHQGLRMAIAGVVLGLALAFVFTRSLATLLFQVEPLDAITMTAAAALVIFVTLVASYVPARRASRLDPTIALHYE